MHRRPARSSMMRACRAAFVAGASLRRLPSRARRALRAALTTAPAGKPAAPSGRAAGSRPGRTRTMRAVDHVGGDLLAAMGRQAVQHHDVVSRQCDESIVDLVRQRTPAGARRPRPPGPSTPRRRCTGRRRRSRPQRIVGHQHAAAGAFSDRGRSLHDRRQAVHIRRATRPVRACRRARRRAESSAPRCCRRRRR